VVDTTGAGDVFHGAYVLAIGAGLDVQDAMAFASAAAALKCTRSGGRAGIPSINDCLAFMRTHQ
jgi:sulfofructose kinase